MFLRVMIAFVKDRPGLDIVKAVEFVNVQVAPEENEQLVLAKVVS